MTSPQLASVRLPVLYCECGRQLVNHLFVIVGTETLVCTWCAKDRDGRGEGRTVAPLQAESGGFLTDPVPALDPVDAVALLVRLGGELA